MRESFTAPTVPDMIVVQPSASSTVHDTGLDRVLGRRWRGTENRSHNSTTHCSQHHRYFFPASLCSYCFDLYYHCAAIAVRSVWRLKVGWQGVSSPLRMFPRPRDVQPPTSPARQRHNEAGIPTTRRTCIAAGFHILRSHKPDVSSASHFRFLLAPSPTSQVCVSLSSSTLVSVSWSHINNDTSLPGHALRPFLHPLCLAHRRQPTVRHQLHSHRL